MSLNYNEVGQVIRVDVGRDITTATPTLKLLPQTGSAKEFTSGVTIPLVDVTVGEEEFLSGEYIEYTTKDKDLDFVGLWRKKAILEFSGSDIEQTNYESFRVLP